MTPMLITPSKTYYYAYLDMVDEYQETGEHYSHHQLAQQDFAAYLCQVQNDAHGVGLPADYAPMTTFWLVSEGVILGESRLRHYLTAALEIEGGHIGYSIRPAQRRQGYGTHILALTLEKARTMRLHSIRVTCDTDNFVSVRVIEKNGGQLSGHATSPRSSLAIILTH